MPSNIRMFADDCVIYRKINSVSDNTSLQDDLQNVQEWCSLWLMELNPNKCKTAPFHRRKNPLIFSYRIANANLELVSPYKYLGVTLFSDLTWATHITNIISSANKTLGFLKRHLRHAPQNVKLLAYQSLIRSKLEYASPIWNPRQIHLINQLESLQNRATRFIHRKYSYDVSISALKRESGLPLLASRRRTASICLFHKFFYSSLGQPPYILPPTRIWSPPTSCAPTCAHRHFFVLILLPCSNRLEWPFWRHYSHHLSLHLFGHFNRFLCNVVNMAFILHVCTHPLCNTPSTGSLRNKNEMKTINHTGTEYSYV